MFVLLAELKSIQVSVWQSRGMDVDGRTGVFIVKANHSTRVIPQREMKARYADLPESGITNFNFRGDARFRSDCK